MLFCVIDGKLFSAAGSRAGERPLRTGIHGRGDYGRGAVYMEGGHMDYSRKLFDWSIFDAYSIDLTGGLSTP